MWKINFLQNLEIIAFIAAFEKSDSMVAVGLPRLIDGESSPVQMLLFFLSEFFSFIIQL